VVQTIASNELRSKHIKGFANNSAVVAEHRWKQIKGEWTWSHWVNKKQKPPEYAKKLRFETHSDIPAALKTKFKLRMSIWLIRFFMQKSNILIVLV